MNYTFTDANEKTFLYGSIITNAEIYTNWQVKLVYVRFLGIMKPKLKNAFNLNMSL